MPYYTLANDGTIEVWADVCFAFDDAGKPACLYTAKEIIRAWDGKGYITGTEPPEPVGQVIAALKVQFTTAVDNHMNTFAATRGYDSMASAASYAGDEDPIFNLEGTYAKRMRSLIYRTAYGILDAVLAGERPMPSIEEVLAELPVLEWPEGEHQQQQEDMLGENRE